MSLSKELIFRSLKSKSSIPGSGVIVDIDSKVLVSNIEFESKVEMVGVLGGGRDLSSGSELRVEFSNGAFSPDTKPRRSRISWTRGTSSDSILGIIMLSGCMLSLRFA